uniref:BTB domain-containing protein n=1 Tax=Panagrolaimus sp. ES5 TaxID=591445 RepID=A0AC34GNU8_9BILA
MFSVKNYEKLYFSLSLNPNQDGAVWIYFNCFSGYDEVKIDSKFSFEIPSRFLPSYKSKKLEHVFSTSESKGIELLDHQELLGDKSENFIIHFTATFTVKSFTFDNCFLSKKLFNNGIKDLKIIVDDQEIMAHKIVLETFSPIFKKMIEAQNTEGDDVIEIHDCDYQVFQNAVNFCYGISDILPTYIDELIDMLEFSNRYEIDDLKNEIEFKLIPHVLENNICKLSNAAIECNAEMLKAHCQSKLTTFVKNGNASVIIEMDNSVDGEFVKDVFQEYFMGH